MKKSAAPSFRPLYEQIKVLLTNSLVAGEWRPGEAIPSEMDLAARYHVSQGTVRKAIDALAAENIVVRRQGRGTFVASHAEPSWQYRFLRLRPDSGERVHPHNFFFGLEQGLASLDAASLEHVWRMRKGDVSFLEGPRALLLRRLLFGHIAHHRGQLSVYYRMLGVPVPGMYGPSADDV